MQLRSTAEVQTIRFRKTLQEWRGALLYALLIAVAMRLLLWLVWNGQITSEATDYVLRGRLLYEGLGFSWPNGAPFANYTPGFPLLLSGLYWLSGGSLLWSGLCLVLIELCTFPLIVHLAIRHDGRTAGIIAAWIWALLPWSPINALSHHGDFLTVLILLMILTLWHPERFRNRTVAAVGLLSGVLAMIRPIFQVFPLLLLIDLVRTQRRTSRPTSRTLVYALLIAAGFALPTVPWMMRNSASVGNFTLAAQSGFNLYIGFHRGATGGYHFDSNDVIDAPPVELITLRDDYLQQRALTYLRLNPGETALLTLKKMARTLVPQSHDWGLFQPSLLDGSRLAYDRFPFVLFLLLTIASAAIGVAGWHALWWESERISPRFLLLGIAALALLSQWIYFASSRYRQPLDISYVLVIAGWCSVKFPMLRSQWRKWVAYIGVGVSVVMFFALCAKRFGFFPG